LSAGRRRCRPRGPDADAGPARTARAPSPRRDIHRFRSNTQSCVGRHNRATLRNAHISRTRSDDAHPPPPVVRTPAKMATVFRRGGWPGAASRAAPATDGCRRGVDRRCRPRRDDADAGPARTARPPSPRRDIHRFRSNTQSYVGRHNRATLRNAHTSRTRPGAAIRPRPAFGRRRRRRRLSPRRLRRTRPGPRRGPAAEPRRCLKLGGEEARRPGWLADAEVRAAAADVADLVQVLAGDLLASGAASCRSAQRAKRRPLTGLCGMGGVLGLTLNPAVPVRRPRRGGRCRPLQATDISSVCWRGSARRPPPVRSRNRSRRARSAGPAVAFALLHRTDPTVEQDRRCHMGETPRPPGLTPQPRSGDDRGMTKSCPGGEICSPMPTGRPNPAIGPLLKAGST
jgi:hypothetical protein